MARCPGCAACFPDTPGPTHPYMESSSGCWAAFGDVLAREYSDPVYFDIHRLSVDAYAVQHPGRPSRQSIQSVGVHLVRLHLFLEQGLAPEKANAAMLAAAKEKHTYYVVGATGVARRDNRRRRGQHSIGHRPQASGKGMGGLCVARLVDPP